MLISEIKTPSVISVALIRYDCVAAVNWMLKEVYVLVFKLISCNPTIVLILVKWVERENQGVTHW